MLREKQQVPSWGLESEASEVGTDVLHVACEGSPAEERLGNGFMRPKIREQQSRGDKVRLMSLPALPTQPVSDPLASHEARGNTCLYDCLGL